MTGVVIGHGFVCQVVLTSHLTLVVHQCSLWALEKDLEGSTLVVGGDGRFFMTEATDIIIRLIDIVLIFIMIIFIGGNETFFSVRRCKYLVVT